MNVTENPLAGSTLSNWLRLCARSGGIDAKYLPRALYVTAMSTLMSPLRLAQSARFGAKIAATEINPRPLFILGHYRSGTTYLQNLLIQDSQWGFVSTTQAVVPGAFLLGRGVSALLGRMLSEKRPMDNVEQSPALPEEPEHAIGNLSLYSFYHGLCFPRSMMDYFTRCVLFEGLGAGERRVWRETYLQVLAAATLAASGKALMLKNPPDMARLEAILEMFPEARFVHIYRNPFVMYPSIRNFYSACIRDWQLQDIGERELHENIMSVYERMMAAYERDKGLIPPGNLVEVGFEDLERDPLAELARIYRSLRLAGFAEAEPAFAAYARAQSGYRKNRYKLSAATVDEIRTRWGEQVERWHYQAPAEMLAGGDADAGKEET